MIEISIPIGQYFIQTDFTFQVKYLGGIHLSMFDKIYTEITGKLHESDSKACNLYSIEHENCLIGFEKLLRRHADLEQDNYHHLKKFPQILTSQAHTRGISISAIAFTDNFKSIGIDLEKSDRVIAPNTHRFFFNDKDSEVFKSEPLKLWTLKEAIYKAASPLSVNQKADLKDFYVEKNFHFFLENNASITGKTHLEEIEIQNQKYFLALAAIY